MKRVLSICFLALGVFFWGEAHACSDQVVDGQENDSVYFTNGFRIGEVTENSAMIWTRFCGQEQPVPVKHQRKDAPFRSPLEFNENTLVEEMAGAVAGASGQVRIRLSSGPEMLEVTWEYVSAGDDYTIKRAVDKLRPNTLYNVSIQGRREPGAPISEVSGQFRTAPDLSEAVPLTFTSSSCQYFWDFDDPERGFRIYDAMMMIRPDFHCHTGDYVYYDKPGPMARNMELARHKWHANNSWPALREFYAHTPLYLQKDDHDMLFNDAYPQMKPFGELDFKDGLSIWYEQVPLEGKPYRTFRWGKDLQIWLVEGREFRSPNHEPDGPGKSIWGAEQKEWFVETVRNSDATFKLLLSPRPEHQFLRVKGGFLVVEVYRKDSIPHIEFTHRDVNGLIVNKKTLTSIN